ncbi:MAG: cobalt ECF transporter T component CbiQ [Candidatus Magnetomorum sp.]|nr:cobalt ECF transporter T component CbiQ [Candidatus Magnetomorum sp.]
MIQEPFATGHSWIHRIDPRYRIVFSGIISLTIAISNQFPALVTGLFFSMVLVGLARLNIKAVIKRLTVVFGFLLLIWATLPLTFEGEALYHLGPITITRQGVMLSAQMTIKSIAILLIFMALITSMTIVTLGHALHRLRLPDKLVYLLLMTYRYIFVIEAEYQCLQKAIKIRCFKPGTNIHSYKTCAYLIGMLFFRASIRAERVHQAMLCRGFKGKFYTLNHFPSGGQNILFGLLMTTIVLGLLILEYS